MRCRVVLALVLFGFAAFAVVGCGGSEEVSPTPETVEGTVGGETETAETETEDAGTTGTEAETTEDEGGGAAGNAEAGKAVWDANGCGGCHTLEAAGSSGNVGPNLDESKPDTALVVERVTNGQGVMPAFGDQLSKEEIANVAAYVVESTGGG
jgi:cytochrome c6